MPLDPHVRKVLLSTATVIVIAAADVAIILLPPSLNNQWTKANASHLIVNVISGNVVLAIVSACLGRCAAAVAFVIMSFLLFWMEMLYG